jgi:hypothetical protein
MSSVAIVAIAAMFFAFLYAGSTGELPLGRVGVQALAPAPEVILYVDPVADIFFPSIPDRNPLR